MVSIADVAAHAGVSPTTVSHTLSGKRKVSDQVRARVLAAMAELGYVPSRSAQNLARGATRIIALVVPDISNGFFAELAKGVEQTAILSGYNVLLCTTGFDHARELLYLEMLKSRAVDGVVYSAGSPPSNSELSRVLGDLPLVLVDEEIPGATATAIVSDNRDGGRLAAEHLLALGHRRGVVLAANDELVSSALRVEGFASAWTAHGADFVVASGGFTEEGGREAVLPYLDALRSGERSCVFAANDLMALGAMDALRSAGLDVPADVSVVGFDDIAPARYSRPGLTTVRQDVGTLGSTAASILVDALAAGHRPDGAHTVVPVEFIARESTAAPVAALAQRGGL